MRSFNLKATNENIYDTLINNTLGRNEDIAGFVSILDDIEGNYSIAIDGDWGSGKTFFVKQLKLALDYASQKIRLENATEDDLHLSSFLKERGIQLNHSFTTVYYDAWLYDNHPDPIVSLIYLIITELLQSDPTKHVEILPKVKELLNGITSVFGVNIDFNILFKTGESSIDSIIEIEKLKSWMYQIFDELIVEKSEKLIVIIDELDRCKPDFAVQLLERIKHFIDDDRVIFVFSMNAAQLTHTINRFYGEKLNSSAYLNRFFDLFFSLKDIHIDQYLEHIDKGRNLSSVAQQLLKLVGQEHFHLSIRNYNTIYQKTKNWEEFVDYSEFRSVEFVYAIQIFSILYWGLQIKDIEKSRRFFQGDYFEEVDSCFNKIDFHDFFRNDFRNEDQQVDMEKMKEWYHTFFRNGEKETGFIRITMKKMREMIQ